MIVGGGITLVSEITFKVFVVHPDAIYVRSQQASVTKLPEVRELGRAVRVAHARTHREPPTADFLPLDCKLSGAPKSADELRSRSVARLLLCTRRSLNDGPVNGGEPTAGIHPAKTLAPGMVAVAVRAISTRVGVPDWTCSERICRVRPCPGRLAQRLGLDRAPYHGEHAVLVLVASSERTLKDVLHDVRIKLDARSRSPAAAFAVREGIV